MHVPQLRALPLAGARQSGGILVLVAALAMLLVAFVGLVVDGGQITAQQRSAQNAADGAALAAAFNILNGTGPTTTPAASLASAVAGQNGVPSTELQMTFTDAGGLSTTSAIAVRYVQADVSHTFPNLFLPIMDLTTATVTATAKVRVTRPTFACEICVLSPSGAGAFTVSGSLSPQLQGGRISVNSSDPAAMRFGTGNFVSNQSITTVGGYTVAAGGTVAPTPTINGGAGADQFPGVTYPNFTTPNNGAFSSTAGATTMQPGVYSTVDIGGTAVVTMAPGIYVITGHFNVIDSATLYADNVMMFFACAGYPAPCAAGGQAGASFTFTSSGNMDAWTAPVTGPYAGMALFYDRNNTSPINISGTGTSDVDIIGTVYAASAAATFGGPDVEMNSMIVVSTLTFNGTSFENEVTYSQNYSTSNSLTLIV